MDDKPIRILLVEDNEDDAQLLQETLIEAKGAPFELEWVDRLSTGLERLAEGGIDVVLLDLSLPDSQGLDTFTRMCMQASDVPIVVMTGLDDEVLALKAMQEGAQDYLVKGQGDSNLLVRAIRYAIERHRMRMELKQYIGVLQASEERFRTIIEKNADGAIIVDKNGIVRFVNPAAEALFGREAEELLNEMFGLPVVAGETTELDIIHRDNGTATVELRMVETEWEGEDAYLASLRDITERKRSEEALQESEERFRKIFNHSNDAVFVIDPAQDEILDVNSKACSILGYSREELLSLPVSAVHPNEMPKLLAFAQSVFEHGQGWIDELTCLAKTGQVLPAEISASVIDISGRTCMIALVRDITERKQAEEALRESEERFRTLVEHAADAFFLHDLEGRFIDANQQACDSLGYTREELLTLSVADIERTAASGRGSELWKQMVPGMPVTTEGVHRRKDGTTFPVEVRIGMFELDGHQLMLALARDITERKRAEEALKASQEYAKNMIDSSLDMIIAVDKDRNITKFNRAAQETFGYRPEEVLGRHVDMLYADTDGGLKVHKTTLENGRCIQEVINKRKNGEIFPSLLSASVLRDGQGEIVGVMGVSRDITEHKRAEAENIRLAAFPKENPSPILESDLDGNIVYVNPAAERELKRLEIELTAGFLPVNHTQLVHNCLEGGQSFHGIETTVRNRVFSWSYHPIPAAGTVHLYATDITERKQAEEALRESEERAQQQDKMASVGQLAAGIAHDFNNLLTVMMGNAQLLEMRSELPESTKENLGSIVSQGQRAAQLIRQILDFSRQTVAQRQAVDLVPFLKETVKLMERTIPESVRIVTEFDSGDYIVETDLTQLQQVVTNLAVNAHHAMPDGGELRMGLSHLQIEPGESSPFPGMEAGDWVVWTVSDTGSGIPPEVMGHIFEPFFTTKKRGEGTGLGLAQVFGIVKQHNGFIDVESEIGAGTTFTIYIQRITQAEDPTEQPEVDLPRGRGSTILIAEDKPEVLKITKAMVENLGYRVLSASNGQQGLEVYDRHRSEITLVLTDMVMPEMGGAGLFHALKERDPAIRVVVMTGYTTEESNRLPQGIAGYIEKPLVVERVAKVLSEALKQAGDDV